jgi:hypothetical protein
MWPDKKENRNLTAAVYESDDENYHPKAQASISCNFADST